MKRMFALLLTAVMIAGTLTACGGSSSSGSSSSAPASGGASSAASSSAASSSSGTAASSSSAKPDKTYVIKLAHVLADDTCSGQACYYFEKLVEERTNGGIDVQVFSASSLGNERDINENLNSGAIQMVYSSPGAMGAALYPELQVLDAPWLFNDWEQAVACVRDPDSAIGGIIQEMYDTTNVQILDMWYRAPRHIFLKGKSVAEPADCKGIKLRSPEIDVYFGSLAAIGFSVTPVAYAETYTAIQTGVVEGLEGPFDLTWGMKFQEVTDTCTKLSWNSGAGPVAINKNFYNSLPEEYQKIVSESCREAGDYSNKLTVEGEADLIKQFEGAGVKMVEADLDAYRAMIPDIIPQISSIWNDNGRNLYDQIHNYAA